MYDIIIIGAGTAGLTAAIYGRRSGKNVLVIEKLTYGGQIINTPEIENYPGIQKISGFEFATALNKQAKDLGAEIVSGDVTGVSANGPDNASFTVETGKAKYEGSKVIIATGSKNRPLGLEHEKEWIGKGISYCATCDGMFFRGKTVAVAGGGNTALEDAAFLSNYCEKVYLIHRRNELRGEQKLQDNLREKENVEFVLNAAIDGIDGQDRLSSINVSDKETGEKRNIPIDGLFIAIGQMPQNEVFVPLVELDDKGYIIAGEDCKTKTPGIYAAGDCRTKEVRQLTTAAADGAVAALAASKDV
ncbi:MAG TPA: thioredoxin-disulfide reductase [Lachnospiraceae bacterium]|nr:thioredoxin-disulfide reductase [Lachnospiraceae bacterium]